MALKKIGVFLACLILLCFIISPSVFADDWGEAPTMDKDNDKVIDPGDQVYIKNDVPISGSNFDRKAATDWVNEAKEDRVASDLFSTVADGYELDPNTDYEVVPTYDWEGNITGVTVKGKEEEPKEFPEPSDLGWEPPEPNPVEWRCYPSSGENKDKRKWQGGWIGSAIDCGTSSAWSSWGAWKCDHTGITPTNKYRERTRTERGCRNGSCYSKTDSDEETFYCKYGCSAGNCLPKAKIVTTPPSHSAITVEEGVEVTFDGTNSEDPDGTINSYSWDFGDGETATGAIVTHTFSNPSQATKTFTVTLTVTDDKGATSQTTQLVNVLHVNQPPTAVIIANPEEGIVPLEVQLDGSSSSDPEDPVSALYFKWEFGDDGSVQEGTGLTNVSHTFEVPTVAADTPVNVTVTLTVTDTEGVSNTATKEIILKNTKPVADFIAQPNEGIAPLSVDFVSYSSDPDGHNIVKYTWDFGDGASDSGSNVTVTHTYSNEGTYTAKLTVEDEYGAVSDTKSVTINVYQPKAITVLNASDVLVGNATTIFVDCSDANDTVNLEILKQNESTGAFEPVSGGSFTVACGSITNYTPVEIGIYKVVASIAGCNTMQCHREVQFQARQEVPELETPEINPVFVIGIVLGVLALIRIKR